MDDRPDGKPLGTVKRFLRALRIVAAVLALLVGLSWTAQWTLSEFALDWKHRIAGPVLLALSLYLAWGIWGSLDGEKR